MRCFARRFALSNVVSHAPQVFQQHHPQRGGQCPQLTQAELVDFLVGMQKGGEQGRVQHTVGMRHIGPGNAVHAR